jgi:phage-related protein
LSCRFGIGTIATVIPKVQTAFTALNTTMAANPIILVVAAVAALIAIFVHLWRTNEDFRNFWINLWKSIAEAVATAVDKIKTFFTKTIPDAFNAILSLRSSVRKYYLSVSLEIDMQHLYSR